MFCVLFGVPDAAEHFVAQLLFSHNCNISVAQHHSSMRTAVLLSLLQYLLVTNIYIYISLPTELLSHVTT